MDLFPDARRTQRSREHHAVPENRSSAMSRTRLIGILLVLSLYLPLHQASAQTWRVGLQVGHWRAHELPEELARLRNSTGAVAGGYREYEVNLLVAQRAAVL